MILEQNPTRTSLVQYNQESYQEYYNQEANLQQLPQYVATGKMHVPDHPPGIQPPYIRTLGLVLEWSDFLGNQACLMSRYRLWALWMLLALMAGVVRFDPQSILP